MKSDKEKSISKHLRWASIWFQTESSWSLSKLKDMKVNSSGLRTGGNGRVTPKPSSLYFGSGAKETTSSEHSAKRLICLGTGQLSSTILRLEPSAAGSRNNLGRRLGFQPKMSLTRLSSSWARRTCLKAITRYIMVVRSRQSIPSTALESCMILLGMFGNISVLLYTHLRALKFIHTMKTSRVRPLMEFMMD